MTEHRRAPLPVDDVVPDVVRLLHAHRALVLIAAPGAGKTTRVPPALVGAGRVLLLQPRRVAARAIARRIAAEQGWTVGREVGWHVRFDRRYDDATALIVATEGVLTARLQADPLLSDVTTVVLDEFHERSIHADLGLALAREAWRARADLRIVVMSATLDAEPVSRFLGSCPVLDVPGRAFDVEVEYRPGADLETVVVDEVPRARGAVLCFLPGAPEIRRAMDRLGARLQAPILPLHGSLSADEQDRALEPSARPRVILATNIAETTLTVPDVRTVIDGGRHKVARYDPDRGIDSLELERVSQDAADQRAGRAGRIGPGRALRLWDPRDRLAPHREPEIARIDLASVVLDILAWGGHPRSFPWFEAPPPQAVDAACALLARLGAVDAANRLTSVGEAMRGLPLHPRLSRVLLAASGARVAALACAALAERHFLPERGCATTSDLLSAADQAVRWPGHVRRVADQIEAAARRALGAAVRPTIPDDDFRRAIHAGYPDRVARRRAPGSDRFLLASGTGATLGRESGVFEAEFVSAVDVTRATSRTEAVIRIASAIDRDWVPVTHTETEHVLDPQRGDARAVRTDWHGAIALGRSPVEIDPDQAAALVARTFLDRGPRPVDEQLLARLAVAALDGGEPIDLPALVLSAARIHPNLHGLDLAAALPFDVRQRLERHAPAELPVPSGRRVRLDYRHGGRVVAAVKLQELFGLTETPRIGPRRVPVTFELLAPNGRPVQVTSDLKSFWAHGYPEVRRELRGRYPKHPWPDDPWTATPTHRIVRRSDT
ncbi:MAG: ATP-dependent helicase HrpB [Acidobacteria bacterium]|nr:ATP-dependent helicase HrpB [Acidobacteriota bacterium]